MSIQWFLAVIYRCGSLISLVAVGYRHREVVALSWIDFNLLIRSECSEHEIYAQERIQRTDLSRIGRNIEKGWRIPKESSHLFSGRHRGQHHVHPEGEREVHGGE